MNSPFPGMDPYIEAAKLWGDFQGGLIHEIRCQLAGLLPERYLVRTGKRSYLVLTDEDGNQEQEIIPEESSPRDLDRVSMRAFEVDEVRERFIAIYTAEDQKHPITVIEVLSPGNRRRNTPGWELYYRKRQSLLLGRANFVEIDLLRGGEKMPMLDRWPECPYTLLVCRRERAPYCLVWPAYSLKPVPVILIPLLRPDPDVLIALQPLIETIYARNRYHRSIDYTKPIHPPLAETEAVFFAERLRARDSSS